MQLLKYFHYNSLNVLRLAFFSIWLTFFTLPEYWDNEVIFRPNSNYIFSLWAPAPTELNFWFFFFTEMHRTKTQTKGYSRFFSFQVPFELSALDNLYAKHALKSRQFIAIKMNKSLLEKRETTLLCSSLLETCVQSFKFGRLSHFSTGARPVFTTRFSVKSSNKENRNIKYPLNKLSDHHPSNFFWNLHFILSKNTLIEFHLGNSLFIVWYWNKMNKKMTIKEDIKKAWVSWLKNE